MKIFLANQNATVYVRDQCCHLQADDVALFRTTRVIELPSIQVRNCLIRIRWELACSAPGIECTSWLNETNLYLPNSFIIRYRVATHSAQATSRMHWWQPSGRDRALTGSTCWSWSPWWSSLWSRSLERWTSPTYTWGPGTVGRWKSTASTSASCPPPES